LVEGGTIFDQKEDEGNEKRRKFFEHHTEGVKGGLRGMRGIRRFKEKGGTPRKLEKRKGD